MNNIKSFLGKLTGVVAVLAVAVLVTFATVNVSTRKASRLIERKTEERVVLGSNAVASFLAYCIETNDWCIDSFLAGLTHVRYDSDSLDKRHSYHWMGETTISLATKEIMTTKLTEFLTVNPDYRSAVMIFEPGVLRKEPRGMAIGVSSDDLTPFDLNEELDVYSSATYLKAKSSNEPFFTRPKTFLGDNTLSISRVVPIYGKNGRFIGVFMTDIKVSYLEQVLSEIISQKDMSLLYMDQYMDILATTDSTKTSLLLENYAATDSSAKYFEFSTEDTKYDVYVFEIPQNNLKLFAYFPEKTTYGELDDFRSEMIWLSAICMLILVLCVFYVFHSYSKRENFRIRMDRELSIASEIQRDILPSSSLTSDRYALTGFQKPAREVGGDLYDYLERDGKVFFCIGDVSGKGVPASMFMAMASSHFRSAARTFDAPEDIAASINNALAERNERFIFCTMFIGVLDIYTGVISYCNAGHNMPVLVTPDGNSSILPITKDMPLGIDSGHSFECGNISAEKGSVLFMYTDGVTEAVSASGEMFSEERLTGSLSKAFASHEGRLEDAVMKDVESFCGRTPPQSDDITMLVLKLA